MPSDKTYIMKSRITIEIDFDNGNQPIIQILQQDSDDVRDKLISSFLEQFGGSSSWCKIKWMGGSSNTDLTSVFKRIHISPIKKEDLIDQAGEIVRLMEVYKRL